VIVVEPVNLRSILEEEGERDPSPPPMTWEGYGPEDKLEEDAYRLAMAFVLNSAPAAENDDDFDAKAGGRSASSWKTIE